jgi:hypothetical protein
MEFGTIWDGCAFFSMAGMLFFLTLPFFWCSLLLFFYRFMGEFAPIFAGLPA